MILPFQGSSTPPDIQQQAEHLLHEYELDDETLQEAQLEQHKIFQNFPTSPAPAASSAPPPLATGTKPKVPSIQEQDDPDNSSPRLFLTLRLTILFLMTMISLWHPLVFMKKYCPLILLHDEGFLTYWLCNLESLKLMIFLPFLVRKCLCSRATNTAI